MRGELQNERVLVAYASDAFAAASAHMSYPGRSRLDLSNAAKIAAFGQLAMGAKAVQR